jgi:CRP-like cAMP-binding protein
LTRRWLVTQVESALERELSLRIMRGGVKPRIEALDKGRALVEQGDLGTDMYVLLDGVFSVEVDGAAVAHVGPGAVVGERALLEGGRQPQRSVRSRPARSRPHQVTRCLPRYSASWLRSIVGMGRGLTERRAHPVHRHLRRKRAHLDSPATEEPVDLVAREQRTEVAGQTRRGTLDDLMGWAVNVAGTQSAVDGVDARVAEILHECAPTR